MSERVFASHRGHCHTSLARRTIKSAASQWRRRAIAALLQSASGEAAEPFASEAAADTGPALVGATAGPSAIETAAGNG